MPARCPQDEINQIWRLFARRGHGDDAQIIETLAHHLLRLGELTQPAGDLSYPQPLPQGPDSEQLEALLKQALESHSPAELLNECLLFKPDHMQAGGRYATPRHIARLMRALTLPPTAKDGRDVADFACGSAGLLVEFPGHLVSGVEISPGLARVARANLLLHGLSAERLHTGDALTAVGDQVKGPFDVIVMNPPFGAPLDAQHVRERLGVPLGTRSETALTWLALDHLKANGALAVLQPGGVLFSTSGGEIELRRRLVARNRLEAVIALPPDAFQPYSQLQTYLLLAHGKNPAAPAAEAPIWFYHVAHDGLSSGRNRQPQPERDQLPALVAAVESGRAAAGRIIVDGDEQLHIRPLPGGGYHVTQAGPGALRVQAIATPGRPALLLGHADKPGRALLIDGDGLEPVPPPKMETVAIEEPLSFRLADDSGGAVALEQKQGKWQLRLKSAYSVKAAASLGGEGYRAVFVSAAGALLSPVLALDSLPSEHRPKDVAALPLVGDDDEDDAGATLLLWDAAAASHTFAGDAGDDGWHAIEGKTAIILLRRAGGAPAEAQYGETRRVFTGEPWHRGVVVDGDGRRFGVAVDRAHVAAQPSYDLSFERHYLPDDDAPDDGKTAAELLADMRQAQRQMAGRLDYLLGIVEMPPAAALPPAAVLDAAPFGTLNAAQTTVWQRIGAKTEEANGVTTAQPFRIAELADELDEAEVEHAVDLFERMGLIVSVAIDGAPYYRLVTERERAA